MQADLNGATFDVTRRRLADLRKDRTPVPDFRASVRKVVVIASPFRGGSSLLTELLRRSNSLLHFQAEMHPMLRLAGWTYPENGAESDYITELVGDAELLDLELGSEVGSPINDWDQIDWHHYAQDVLWRWAVQWPGSTATLADVEGMVLRAVADLDPAKGAGIESHLRLINLKLLARLAADCRAVNPYYLDVSAAELEDSFPHASRPSGPHGRTVIEFAPLVVPRPWKRATRDDVETMTVVTKTPINVHKLAALRKFFSHADFRVLHLTRNPGAAINSLYEAWLSPWFFNASVDIPLCINGYTRQEQSWSAHWWKFDFPPGWEGLACMPLERVCAGQWCAAHKAILRFLEKNKNVEVLRVRYEDLIGSTSDRTRVVEDLASWLGIDRSDLLDPALQGLTPVYSVTPPRPTKWRGNRTLLSDVLRDPEVREVTADLGYSENIATWR